MPWIAAAALTSPAPDTKKNADFNDAMAVFKAHCTPCHNGEVARGGLRLDTAEGVAKGGNNGALIKPGNAKGSLLMQRIRGEGDLPRMPQGFAPISQTKEDIVASWINAGGKVTATKAKLHWSYVPVSRPPVPEVKRKDWVQNPIDNFILARLEKGRLGPSPRAEWATLARRISLDLTGLPPDIDADAGALTAGYDGIDQFIDGRLASPHYGEKLATMWLDLARYADSNGYEKDLNRSIWHFRDWVISAFNRDEPFDQFTIDQLAGDLKPDATTDDLVAVGFHRNTLYNGEEGVDKGEQRWLTLVDRVGTTGTAWLGTSIACAQCHDHKYDPVSQEDFYRFLAFFESADEVTLDMVSPEARQQEREVRALEAKYRESKDESEKAELKAKIDAARKELAPKLQPGTTLSFSGSKDRAAETPIRLKGAYLTPGETVAAHTPHFLFQNAEPKVKNRLDLAKWIVDKRNPLTARVLVNRLWEQLFGRGLVETSEEFGTQGTRPSHPELLDWLAAELMDHDWSIKHIMRLIVSSATYQQTSVTRPGLLSRDPENILLARGPRFRMSAEMIRDNALKIAGTFDSKVGGQSVYPYQPDGVWNIPYTGETWQMDRSSRRRALYTFIKRSAPYPSMIAFDATSRESCTGRRTLTNSPMQALTLLNDQAYVDLAKEFADRMVTSDNLDANLKRGFRLALIREPQPRELATLRQLWQQQAALPDPMVSTGGALAKRISPNEALAYVLVAQVLLNLDETITKE